MENSTAVMPQWIAKMYPGKTGRDHLGLGSVSSDQILPTLVPSINVLTYHPRYHSFYIFLLDEYWQRDLPRNNAAWTAFFRPREFIFSVGAYLCQQPEHGQMGNVVGGQKTGSLDIQGRSSFDTSTNYIVSSLGGYGLYYKTVMAELGLIYPGGQGLPYPVDVPSDPIGKEAAQAYRETVQETEYYKKYFDLDKIEVPREVVQEYIHKACLCQLKTDKAPDQEAIRDLFMDGGNPRAAKYRKSTMRLFLDIANQTKDHELDEDDFRQLVYFNKTQKGILYSPSKDLDMISKQWQLYQAREYYTYALNALWGILCDWGISNNGERLALPYEKFWDHLEKTMDYSKMNSILKIDFPTSKVNSSMSELITWSLGLVGAANQEDFSSKCTIDSPINEHLLYQKINANRSDQDIVLHCSFLLLIIIYLRYGQMQRWQEPEWEIAKMGSNGRLSLNGFVRETEKFKKSGPVTLLEYAKQIYKKYIIQQHITIATRKLPDNTFRFRHEGKRLRFFKHYNSLNFMNSRFDSISTTIFELGYCGDLHLADHGVTNAGQTLLDGTQS